MSKKSKNEGPAPTPLPDKNNVDDLSEKEIKRAFESLVKRKFSKEQTEQANNYKELDRILKEYMECCIIMGYDVKGNGIVRIIHDNHLQNDALHHLLQKVVMSHLGPPGMMGGNSLE
tara:strand:- start:13495 stop:13845 length:351 start_codon:yes stop_codon:yes gene_type:complete